MATPIFPHRSRRFVAIPDWVLRKLYVKGSLRETGSGRFAFSLQNTLSTASLLGPPRIVVNGIHYDAKDIRAKGLDVPSLSPAAPFMFRKGDKVTIRLPGHLLRGGNRIHLTVPTQEFGEIELYVEDKEAEFCDVPGAKGEEE